jgi:hypothetical protein
MKMSERLLRSVEHYEARLRLSAAGRKTEDEIRRQVDNFALAAARIDPVIDQSREVLCRYGVSTIWFAAYHAFTLELYKLTRSELPTDDIRERYALVLAKWAKRGFKQAVLEAIAAEVFLLALPEPPSVGRGEEGQDRKA